MISLKATPRRWPPLYRTSWRTPALTLVRGYRHARMTPNDTNESTIPPAVMPSADKSMLSDVRSDRLFPFESKLPHTGSSRCFYISRDPILQKEDLLLLPYSFTPRLHEAPTYTGGPIFVKHPPNTPSHRRASVAASSTIERRCHRRAFPKVSISRLMHQLMILVLLS